MFDILPDITSCGNRAVETAHNGWKTNPHSRNQRGARFQFLETDGVQSETEPTNTDGLGPTNRVS